MSNFLSPIAGLATSVYGAASVLSGAGGITNTTVKLAGFALAGFMVPERMPFGGDQGMSVHQLPGGVRIVDVMGAVDRDITWSGIIFSNDAGTAQDADVVAQQLDYIRRQGQVVNLSFWKHSYQVVIKSFEADFEKYFQIPYKITCVVVIDNSAPSQASQFMAALSLILNDMTTILGIAELVLSMTVTYPLPGPVSTSQGVVTTPTFALIPGPTIAGINLTALAAAISAANIYFTATSSISDLNAQALSVAQATISAIVAQAQAAQVLMDAYIAESVAKFNFVGGVLPGLSGSVNANEYTNYSTIVLQEAGIIQIGSAAMRMLDNLNLQNSVNVITPLVWNSDSD